MKEEAILGYLESFEAGKTWKQYLPVILNHLVHKYSTENCNMTDAFFAICHQIANHTVR